MSVDGRQVCCTVSSCYCRIHLVYPARWVVAIGVTRAVTAQVESVCSVWNDIFKRCSTLSQLVRDSLRRGQRDLCKNVRGLEHTGAFNRHPRWMWMFNVVVDKCCPNRNRCVHAFFWSLRSFQSVCRECASVIQLRLVKRAGQGANRNDESNHSVKVTRTRCNKVIGED